MAATVQPQLGLTAYDALEIIESKDETVKDSIKKLQTGKLPLEQQSP